MTDRSEPDLLVQLKLDAICMEFEERCFVGQGPVIEEHLTGLQEPDRSHLLRHLLQIEFEFRVTNGNPFDAQEYVDRFPDQSALVRGVYEEHASRSQSPDVTDHRMDPSLFDTECDNSTGASESSGELGAVGIPPSRISQYRVVRKIGQGGMGAVYEAIQDKPRRRVAIKVLASTLASEALVRRFQFESQVLGVLKHPGIAQVFEAGTERTEVGCTSVLCDGIGGWRAADGLCSSAKTG